ncbi:ERBB receptor feedback inhibitor 1a [Trichomycterus rosablanca]|uniref:ERBB receptor feedback inhibitor 1a n=1 Tax=Trichomycterus rosablanca TaxID=2290929 RepID=UPI002F353DFE
MRLDCSWSMSIAGLSAQEICLPPQSLFLRSSQCHSMSRAKPSWKCDHDLDNFYFTLEPSVNCNVQSRQPLPSFFSANKQKLHSHPIHSPAAQPLLPEKSRPTLLTLSSKLDPHATSTVKDDQIAPGFHRLSVSDPPQTPGRAAKPLPPLPSSAELSSDQTVDSDVEFYNGDDSRCLVSDSCPKPSPFRYGMHSRKSLRDCGQINYAYFEGPVPPQKKQLQQSKKKQEHESQENLLQEQREQELQEQQQQQQRLACQQQQDRAQRKLRRSHSGPAGSYNKHSALLRLSCHQRETHDQDKPEIPPRAPIPPRPAKTGDYRRWSAEVSARTGSDDDRPPKVPPREPLCSSISQAPSQKTLPIYLNGIMPPTQSFAPDPKYVRRSLQRQNSEGSPCILPIMENGKKASTTHYFLLPQRPTKTIYPEFVDSETSRKTEASSSSLDWSDDSKKKTHLDLV